MKHIRTLLMWTEVSFLPQWGRKHPEQGSFLPTFPLTMSAPLPHHPCTHPPLHPPSASPFIFSCFCFPKDLKADARHLMFWKASISKIISTQDKRSFPSGQTPDKVSVLRVAARCCFWTLGFIFLFPPPQFQGSVLDSGGDSKTDLWKLIFPFRVKNKSYAIMNQFLQLFAQQCTVKTLSPFCHTYM